MKKISEGHYKVKYWMYVDWKEAGRKLILPLIFGGLFWGMIYIFILL